MKNAIKFLLFILISFVLVACKNRKQEKSSVQINAQSLTGNEIDARLKSADSIVVVFYKDPYGKDSLRYTRFYTQVSSTNSKDLDILKSQVENNFSASAAKQGCRSEGKIWCYLDRKVFQTVYFNTQCDHGCCHVYLIKDGNFYYSTLNENFVEWLKEMKGLAKDPNILQQYEQ